MDLDPWSGADTSSLRARIFSILRFVLGFLSTHSSGLFLGVSSGSDWISRYSSLKARGRRRRVGRGEPPGLKPEIRVTREPNIPASRIELASSRAPPPTMPSPTSGFALGIAIFLFLFCCFQNEKISFL